MTPAAYFAKAAKAKERGPTEHRSPCTQGLGWSRETGPKKKTPEWPITATRGFCETI